MPVASVEFLFLRDDLCKWIVRNVVKEATQQAHGALIKIVFKEKIQVEDFLEVAQAGAIPDEGFSLGFSISL